MKKGRDADQMALKGTEDDEILTRLGDRVEKAIATIEQLRKERDSLRRRLEAAEQKVRESEEDAQRFASVAGAHRGKDARRTSRDAPEIETILASLEQLEELAEATAE